jgi:ribosomal protein S17E
MTYDLYATEIERNKKFVKELQEISNKQLPSDIYN